MSTHQVMHRLQAYQAGKALPQYSTLHFPIVRDRDLLVVAFIRMGGESAPWGIAVGQPRRRPKLLTISEPRNRDARADMVAEFASILLQHFNHPAYTPPSVDLGWLPTRQVWLPNPSHLEMLHYLAYAYTFTKWGEDSRAHRLNQVGRLAGWLFRESQRPGQVATVTSTTALKTSYVFPAQDVRQNHLGFLLAWLTASGDGEKRAADAAQAERTSISTSLDPMLERDRLVPLIEEYNSVVKTGHSDAVVSCSVRLREVLEPELLRRFNLTEAAVQVLRRDKRKPNPGLEVLEDGGRSEMFYRYLAPEIQRQNPYNGSIYTPSPETDRNPIAAAALYFQHQASDELRQAALIHHDRELQDEAIAAGKAFRGKVTLVRDEGTDRSCKPIWTLESTITSTRVRVGNRLRVAGLASRQVRVRSLNSGAVGITLEVEVTELKTRPRGPASRKVPSATDHRLLGKIVTLLPAADEAMDHRRIEKLWTQNTPGSWLTSGRPGGQRAALPAEIADDLAGANQW
jgi:hypothetical protein